MSHPPALRCVEIHRLVDGVERVVLRATIDETHQVRLIGLPEFVEAYQTVGGHTPDEGIWYLYALRDELDVTTSSAYGSPFATAV